MATNNQDQDLSVLEKKDANALTGKDIFFTILRNLHWLILCAAIGAVIPRVIVHACASLGPTV